MQNKNKCFRRYSGDDVASVVMPHRHKKCEPKFIVVNQSNRCRKKWMNYLSIVLGIHDFPSAAVHATDACISLLPPPLESDNNFHICMTIHVKIASIVNTKHKTVLLTTV